MTRTTLIGPLERAVACGFLLLALGACGPRQDPDASEEPPVQRPAAEPERELRPPADAAVPAPPPGAPSLGSLAGQIVIDGSSTVFPITEEVSRRFQELAPEVEIRLGVSGTGGGFKKFCAGETMLSDASRPIKAAEKAKCRSRRIEFIELPVAFDGMSVVVHPDNHWVRCVTLGELGQLWEPAAEATVDHWHQIRAEWPEEPIVLYAPGRDSGTFDYFTSAVVGREGVSRDDFIGSEDDYLLAQDIAGDRRGLGFFGYAYYREYRERLRLVEIDGGRGCVAPSEETIRAGTYRPLSRPIFVYVSLAALDRPEVEAFVDFYLTVAADCVTTAGYVALPARAYQLAGRRVSERRIGSMFEGGSRVGLSIEALLELEAAETAR